MTREETQGTREELGRNKDQGTRGNPGGTEGPPPSDPQNLCKAMQKLTLVIDKLNPRATQ